ncbi:Uncharacterised protein [Mycobacterium tuberculosis]|nr:Uncharacterised protein [Mycobacterium tuberculosis]
MWKRGAPASVGFLDTYLARDPEDVDDPDRHAAEHVAKFVNRMYGNAIQPR